MEVDIIIALSIAVALIFTVAQVTRIIRTGAMHKTLRKGIEQGQPLNVELIERLEKSPAPGAIDQRIGFVLVALALALLTAGLIQGDAEKIRNMATAAMFPLFVGSALLLRLRLANRQQVEP